jgi:thymidylate kinase
VFTVALIGPDGAGKTTISSRLEAELGLPIKSIYMGVNLHSSGVMLPHTRLLLALRRRSRNPDPNAVSDLETHKEPPKTLTRRSASAVRSGLRLTNWVAEEWYRQMIAAYHTRRGAIVVFDRHFLADYYAEDIRDTDAGRCLSRRIHGFLLRRAYPKPDLVIFLDAPAEVLYARKPEGSLNRLRQKREEYLDLRTLLPELVVIDAGMPTEEVTKEVARVIRAFYERQQMGAPSRIVRPQVKPRGRDSSQGERD